MVQVAVACCPMWVSIGSVLQNYPVVLTIEDTGRKINRAQGHTYERDLH